MFAPALKCLHSGLHIAWSSRLWIVSARVSDLGKDSYIAADDEAQRWQGWRADQIPQHPISFYVELPLEGPTQIVRPNLNFLFFALIDRVELDLVGTITIVRHADGEHHLGGTMRQGRRSQGLGREGLRAVLPIAHRHFGLGQVEAQCEVGNLASARWLGSAGFTRVPGPPRHVLPDGREVDSLSFSKVDRRAKRRCRWLVDDPYGTPLKPVSSTRVRQS